MPTSRAVKSRSTRSASNTKAGKPAAKKLAARAAAPAGASKAKAPTAKTSRAKSGGGMSFAQAMAALEKAGTEQARKTYARHGVTIPMFGVSFAVLKTMVKQIGVDHELARQLWDSGNHDARTLAVKIADPAKVTPGELDRWACEHRLRSCGGYVPALASESPLGSVKAREWLASKDEALRVAGWTLAGYLTHANESESDEWFLELIHRIEKTIHQSANDERYAMNSALIAFGGRSKALRQAATIAAEKIGVVEVDHGDTSCETPQAVQYIEKMWAFAKAKNFATPAAQERAREKMRTRC